MSKVGLGILTTPKRTISDNVWKFTGEGTHVEVFQDSTGLGAAHGRNALLTSLQNCDYIFLMDDDCYPVMAGWEAYFITQAQTHTVHHMALVESFKDKLEYCHGEMGYWHGGLGAFTFQTKRILQEVGGYNKAYQKYGFEDCGRLQRIARSGLNRTDLNPFPVRGLAYIHSEDVFAENPVQNYSHEEKLGFIEANQPLFLKEQSGPLFHDYK